MQLLTSQESESVINGLNVMGALFGFGMDLTRTKMAVTDNLGLFKRNSLLIPIAIWEKVFAFQESWDITIQIASILILQLALPSEYAQFLYKKRKQRIKMNVDNSRSFELPLTKGGMANDDQVEHSDKENGGEINVNKRLAVTPEDTRGKITDNSLEVFLKHIHTVKSTKNDQRAEKVSFSLAGFSADNGSADNSLVEINWLEKKFQEEELVQLLSLFRMHFSREEHNWASIKVTNKSVEIIFDAPLPVTSPKDDPKVVENSKINPEENTKKMNDILTKESAQLQLVSLPSKVIQSGPESKKTKENVFAKDSKPEAPQQEPLSHIKSKEDYLSSFEKAIPVMRYSSPRPLLDIPESKPAFKSRHLSPALEPDSQNRKKSREPYLENPVKKIIKMKKKLFESDLQAARTVDSVEKVILDSLDPRIDFATHQHSLNDFNRVARPVLMHTNTSAMLNRDQDASSGGRQSATRREINRILSSHFIKPPVDASMKYVASPKSMLVNGHKSSGNTRVAANSASKPRMLAKTRDKNSSVGFLGDKSNKFNTFHGDSTRERPSLSKKSSHLLTSLKKKMLNNIGNSKKNDKMTVDRVSKRNLGMITVNGPELRPKLALGQGRATCNLLRSSTND